MYKLLIKDRQGNWQTADMGDDVPAMNFQINDIATLKDLNNNYSQTLKLPRTPNNCTLFEYADNFDILTDVPYSKHDCRLFSNDSIICGPGSILYLDKINEFFETQIASGSAGLFETLQDKPMSDLDLGTYVLGSHAQSDYFIEPIHGRYCVPVATFLKGGATVQDYSADHSYPFVFLKPVIENILKTNGYNLPNGTLVTNLTDADWNTKAVNICSKNLSSDSFTPLDANASGYSVVTSGSQSIVFTSTNTRLTPTTSGFNGLNWIAPDDMDIRVRFSCNIPGSQPMARLRVLHNSTFILDTGAERVTNFEQVVSVIKGDTIAASAFMFTGSTSSSLFFSFSLTDAISDVVPIGGKIHFSNNLGFDMQFDFFKSFVQSFGLTVIVDESTKIVSAYTMQELYDNKTKKLNWSKKLNDIEKNTVFSIGTYGQTNTIKFEDNSDDKVTDSGSFTITNAALPISKELFSITFEAVKSVNYYIANIPIEEKAEDGTITFKGGKPHLVDIGLNPVTHESCNALHVKVQSLIDTYYTKLVQMLTNAKMLTDVELWLTDQDIEDLDQFTPVWIEKYGCYFYVNKVKNYISGKLTKCDLIKL